MYRSMYTNDNTMSKRGRALTHFVGDEDQFQNCYFSGGGVSEASLQSRFPQSGRELRRATEGTNIY